MSRSYKKNKYRKLGRQIITTLFKAGGETLEFLVFLSDRRRIGFEEYKDREYQSYYQSLRRLERHKMVSLKKKHDRLLIKLTQKGLLIAQTIEEMQIAPLKWSVWDGHWRMIAFDIPESQRTIRDALRRKIKELGFIELQKSLFVIPWPCRKQIQRIQKLYQADKHVKYLEVKSFDGEEMLKRKFGIK